MLTCFADSCSQRAGLNRREFLRVGGLGTAGLSLASLLRHEAGAAAGRRPKSVIYIVLGGGLSHIDSYDPKPDAPAEYRGPFSTIATRIPGVPVCELMPLQAGMLDRLSLLRGVRSVENDHYLSEVYTGLPRGAGRRPAFGSVTSRLAPGNSPLPPYVALNPATIDDFEYEKPYYAGAGHAPFRPFDATLADLSPAIPLSQLADRRQLQTAFDAVRRRADRLEAERGIDKFQAQALDMITSPQVREAFDLSREPADSLDAFGRGKYPHQTYKDILYDWNPKPFLMARRLVEAGVRVVTLRAADWDHHSSANGDIFFALRCLLPLVDQAIHGLCTQLTERGLDEDVLVVLVSEFGRTPKISLPGPGREHWAEAGCILFHGGGLNMGQVVGQTDARAERAVERETNFQSVMATIYHVLGIDPRTTLADFGGRPQYLLDDARPVRELVG